MNKKLIYLVVGARPNFMKIAPLVRALEKTSKNFRFRLIHTGQHNNSEMNEVFLADLGIPSPDVYLNGSGGSHAEQTAKIMIEFEKECMKIRPDFVLVVGDINSTLACAIVSKKLDINLIHVEAGLRSRDRKMPEEINRILTDAISDLFFVTEPSAVDNLVAEGHDLEKIYYVGNVMIDNLFYQLKKLSSIDQTNFDSYKLKSSLNRYGVLTLHRPSNVDRPEDLEGIIKSVNQVSKIIPIIFPVHPRTNITLKKCNIIFSSEVHLLPPLAYKEFLSIWKDSEFIMTDSGGLQEETTALGIPCVTLRNNTERPSTIISGTNRLVGSPPLGLSKTVKHILSEDKAGSKIPEYWDGLAAERIIEILTKI